MHNMTPKYITTSRQFAEHLAPFLVVALISVTLLSMSVTVSAQTITCTPAAGGPTYTVTPPATCNAGDCQVGKLCNPTTYKDINALLLAVVKEVMKYGLLLIVFFLVLAGFKFVVAQGNPEKISEAKKMLVWVVVGAFVLIGVLVIREAVCGTVDKIRGIPNTEAPDSDRRACPTTPP